jgi:hypothetical protein
MVQEAEPVSADAVRAEMSRILGSPHFDASARNRAFFTYVVEEALAGRNDRIKAYEIATSEFGATGLTRAGLDVSDPPATEQVPLESF